MSYSSIMADLIVSFIEGTVWLLGGAVYAIIGVLDGLVATITYLPSILINIYFLMDHILLGIFSSIKLILIFFWYSASFLFYLPSNLGHFFNSILSATKVCLNWSYEVFSPIIPSLISLGFQIFDLFKQFIVYIIGSSRRFIYQLVTVKTTNTFIESLSHILSRTKGLWLAFTYRLQSLIYWPFRAFLNSCEAIYNDVHSVYLRLFHYLWDLPRASFAKFSSYLQSFDSRKLNLQMNTKLKEYPSYGAGWLTRFSQLMLTFALIIFVTAVLVILYDMRYKVLAAVSKLFEQFVRNVSHILQIGQRGGDGIDRHNRDRAHFPLEGQREDQDMDVGSDEDIEDDDEEVEEGDRGILQPPHPPVGHPRGASTEREIRANLPSTSSIRRTRNYERLLQEEIDKQLCVVCQDHEKDTLIFPCKHLCACNDCIEQITSSVFLDSRRCPLCRTKISSYLDVYT